MGDKAASCYLFDFLTAITFNGEPLNDTAIVLNSVGMKEKSVDKIRSLHPGTIELYRDNGSAGQSLMAYFKSELSGITIVDKAEIYQGFDDLNAWHVSKTQHLNRNS